MSGDCLVDVAVLRAQPEVFGSVASDPTVSRLVGTLAADVETVLPASAPPEPKRGRRCGRGDDRWAGALGPVTAVG